MEAEEKEPDDKETFKRALWIINSALDDSPGDLYRISIGPKRLGKGCSIDILTGQR